MPVGGGGNQLAAHVLDINEMPVRAIPLCPGPSCVFGNIDALVRAKDDFSLVLCQCAYIAHIRASVAH